MTKNFKLNEEEMTLAVNALASSEEYLLYRKLQVGAKIAEIIQGYQDVIDNVDKKQGKTTEPAAPAAPGEEGTEQPQPDKENDEEDNGLPKKK